LILVAFFLGLSTGTSRADDPFGSASAPQPKESAREMAFDQVNWKRPQGVFSWITIARGYETPWDTIGRPGWMTIEDAYVKPVDPGVSEFSADTEEFYIVFEGQPLDAPGQFAAAWYEMQNGQPLTTEPLGKDVIELEMNQRFGYFQIFRPADGWKPGKYQIKIYYGSPGQDLHATNIIGTLEFTIK
jgi:hypothetical protein